MPFLIDLISSVANFDFGVVWRYLSNVTSQRQCVASHFCCEVEINGKYRAAENAETTINLEAESVSIIAPVYLGTYLGTY